MHINIDLRREIVTVTPVALRSYILPTIGSAALAAYFFWVVWWLTDNKDTVAGLGYWYTTMLWASTLICLWMWLVKSIRRVPASLGDLFKWGATKLPNGQ